MTSFQWAFVIGTATVLALVFVLVWIGGKDNPTKPY